MGHTYRGGKSGCKMVTLFDSYSYNLPICQTAESFRNILSAMGPYRDSISLKKSPLLGLYTGSEAQLDLATVRYHALGAYAKSVYLVYIIFLQS